jgi:UDP-N-acetylglucosamine/UDP-N-acetylgalactosamine diphosphorylase
MAGGTSRKNHSEVGSSYIHFNYTPSQDKATASLIGDVPRGVMLDQKPIFLGGQGGMVGPCRLNFGVTVAAGTIVRKDEIRKDRLIFGREGKGGSIPFEPGRYHSNKRIIMNNIIYIGNLIALQQWYRQVRTLFISTRFPEPLMSGLKKNIQAAIDERIERLKTVCLKTPEAGHQGPGISERWPQLNEALKVRQEKEGDTELRDKFLESVSRRISTTGKDYITIIQGLAAKDSENGVRWLQGIVDRVTSEAQGIMPALA